MNRGETASLAGAASAVLEPVYERLARIAQAVVESRPAVGRPWSEPDLAAAQRLIVELIREDALQVGLGFVAAPGVIDGSARYMLWWQLAEQRTTRLRLNFDPTSIDVYDYLEMEWFRLPQEGSRRAITGPYVDYSGAELYVLTASLPIVIEGIFVGVAGADLLSAELERQLVAILGEASTEALIVSAERRIIAANRARWVFGSRLASMPVAGARVAGTTILATEPIAADVGWMLALTDDTHRVEREISP